MAVRLDIRPRLVLRDEPAAKARKRWRLPPLTVPAVTYWLGMAALTYAFARLGTAPVEPALASEPTRVDAVQEPEPAAAPEPTPAPAPAPEPVAALATPPAAEVAPEPPPRELPEPEPDHQLESARESAAPHQREREPRRASSSQDDSVAASPPRAALADARETPRLTFPEFTDASRPRAPERASDGPRIDALFPRASDRQPNADEPSPSAPPKSDEGGPVVSSSCEAAVARNNEQYEIGGPRGPADITRGAYASILENGRYLTGCSLPAKTVFEICAAVKGGRAVGVTVSSNPPSAALNACVRRAVSRLRFPESPRLDVTRTRFDAAR
jgi:hypothetical protein